MWRSQRETLGLPGDNDLWFRWFPLNLQWPGRAKAPWAGRCKQGYGVRSANYHLPFGLKHKGCWSCQRGHHWEENYCLTQYWHGLWKLAMWSESAMNTDYICSCIKISIWQLADKIEQFNIINIAQNCYVITCVNWCPQPSEVTVEMLVMRFCHFIFIWQCTFPQEICSKVLAHSCKNNLVKLSKMYSAAC